MRILGLSAFQRDAAAALLCDGVPVAGAHEEHFTKKRLDAALPRRAIRHCLEAQGLQGPELDRVVFYERPLRKFERLLATQLRAFPRSARPFARTMFNWLGDRLWIKNRIADELGIAPERIGFVDHALAHAAAAYYGSSFDEAAVLVLDDVGEWATTLLARARGNALEPLGELHHPHSLGLFASAVTQFLGFEPGSDEELVEALSAWGEPRYAEALAGLVRACAPAAPGSDGSPGSPGNDGAFEVDQRPFRFAFDPDVYFNQELVELLGPHREPGSPLRFEAAPDAAEGRRDADVAASLQQVLEERALALAHTLFALTSSPNLCLAGALATNRRLVARLAEDGPFAQLSVPFEPGKAGAALGAAYLAHATATAERPRALERGADAALGARLVGVGEPGARSLGSELQQALVERLAAGATVAWVRGPQDFGRRAATRRLLLADARPADARQRLLGAVQRSEPYLPCRLLLPIDEAERFGLPAAHLDLLRGAGLLVAASDELRRRAPAALEPDARAWVQLVAPDDDPELHALLVALGRAHGTPALCGTNFHLRGAPIVRTELDAVDAFRRSHLDALFVEDRLYTRELTAAHE